MDEAPSPPNRNILSDDIDKKSLKEQLDEIKDVLNNPERIEAYAKKNKQLRAFVEKQKRFKIPNKVVREVKKKYKKSKIIIVLLKTNRTIDFIVGQLVNGMVFVNGTPHEASVDFVFVYKNVPLLVIPEWSLSPIGTKDYYEAKKEGKSAEPSTIILRAIESKEAMQIDKPKLSGKALIWILLGVAVLVGVFIFNRK
jgi:adenine/guanine phosphoribosyltransferase-like PRPP-binding protein